MAKSSEITIFGRNDEREIEKNANYLPKVNADFEAFSTWMSEISDLDDHSESLHRIYRVRVKTKCQGYR